MWVWRIGVEQVLSHVVALATSRTYAQPMDSTTMPYSGLDTKKGAPLPELVSTSILEVVLNQQGSYSLQQHPSPELGVPDSILATREDLSLLYSVLSQSLPNRGFPGPGTDGVHVSQSTLPDNPDPPHPRALGPAVPAFASRVTDPNAPVLVTPGPNSAVTASPEETISVESDLSNAGPDLVPTGPILKPAGSTSAQLAGVAGTQNPGEAPTDTATAVTPDVADAPLSRPGQRWGPAVGTEDTDLTRAQFFCGMANKREHAWGEVPQTSGSLSPFKQAIVHQAVEAGHDGQYVAALLDMLRRGDDGITWRYMYDQVRRSLP